MSHLRNKALVLAIALFACDFSIRAGDDKAQSVTLEITTALNEKMTVEIEATTNRKQLPALDHMTDVCVAQAPSLRLALDQGNAVYFIVPLRLVKQIAVAGKEHRVTLGDDTVVQGNLLTTVTAKDGKVYDLSAASSVTNAAAAKSQKPDPKLQRLTLRIAKPANTTHDVIRPRIRTERVGADPLTMIVDGKNVQANLADFDKVSLTKKNKTWQIAVTAPGAAEKTAELVMRNGWWFLGCETTNGCILILRGQTEDPRFPDNPGFSLEKAKGSSVIEK